MVMADIATSRDGRRRDAPLAGPILRVRHHHDAQDAARPRGGMVMCKQEFAEALDKAVFPGVQGGPLMHVIAAKAVAFAEALTPGYRDYIAKVLENASTLCSELQSLGWRMVSGGTDTHLMLINLGSDGISGRRARTVSARPASPSTRTPCRSTRASPTSAPAPYRHPGHHHARHGPARDEGDRRADRPRSQERGRGRLGQGQDEVEELTKTFPLYGQA